MTTDDDDWADVEVVVLGCWSKRTMPVEPYKGCITGTCSLCEGELWIGAKQQEVAEEHRALGRELNTMCLECSAALELARMQVGTGANDPRQVLSLGGEVTPAGQARMDQISKQLGVDIGGRHTTEEDVDG